ncbi:hypothetical protein [Streptomyces sp. NPDC048192]|jgi:hypothetical protein|uniref:hypothetical protein n=1 Tax=Streptomyces sp. NPDC048192 TaxID=3365510 RepID=UPI0037180C13
MAEWLLANDCMRAAGVAPVPFYGGGEDLTSDPYRVARRYGPIVEAQVSRYGYHLPPDWLGDHKSSAFKPMTPAQKRVWYGSANGLSPEGCQFKAIRNLTQNGKLKVDAPIAQQIKSDSFAKSLKDKRVVRVTSAWSRCMSAYGFEFTSPLDALSKANIDTAAPTESEMTTAEDDYHCKISTGLISKWQSVETSIEDREIAHDAHALSQERSGIKNMVAASHAIMAAHGK